jgi:hypothetical protein
MGRARLVFRVHRIGEIDHLVVGQATEQLLVILYELSLPEQNSPEWAK